MADNEISAPDAEVRPGRYKHYKNREYLVLGLADHNGAVGDHRNEGLAVLSGTEGEDPPTCVEVFYCDAGRYHYTSQRDLGILVVYRPDYGAKRLTVRPVDEFTSLAHGEVRYARIADA